MFSPCSVIQYFYTSSFSIVLMGKKLVALFLLSSWCLVAVSVLWLFLVVTSVGQQYVIVVFPDHTRIVLVSLRSFVSRSWCHGLECNMWLRNVLAICTCLQFQVQ